MAAIAASMAQVTAPSMIKLESARPTGQILDNIGDNQAVLYIFPKWKFDQVKSVFRCVQSVWF